MYYHWNFTPLSETTFSNRDNLIWFMKKVILKIEQTVNEKHSFSFYFFQVHFDTFALNKFLAKQTEKEAFSDD